MLRDVGFSYGVGLPGVHGVNATIPAGTFTVIVGPNGSGKSTLAQIMAGILEPYTPRDAARDLLAIGSDPFHFTKVSEVMVDRGSPGSVDETYAHKPSVIYHDGALYHFYCSVAGAWPNEVRGISLVRSKPW